MFGPTALERDCNLFIVSIKFGIYDDTFSECTMMYSHTYFKARLNWLPIDGIPSGFSLIGPVFPGKTVQTHTYNEIGG